MQELKRLNRRLHAEVLKANAVVEAIKETQAPSQTPPSWRRQEGLTLAFLITIFIAILTTAMVGSGGVPALLDFLEKHGYITLRKSN